MIGGSARWVSETASDARKILLSVVERTADQVFIPLTVGGGVRSVEDMAAVSYTHLLAHETRDDRRQRQMGIRDSVRRAKNPAQRGRANRRPGLHPADGGGWGAQRGRHGGCLLYTSPSPRD